MVIPAMIAQLERIKLHRPALNVIYVHLALINRVLGKVVVLNVLQGDSLTFLDEILFVINVH